MNVDEYVDGIVSKVGLIAPQLLDVVRNPPYLQIVKVSALSERQFRAAMEGECPGCGSDVLDRVESENDEWVWAACPDCCWSESFRVVARRNRYIWRMLPTAVSADRASNG